MTHAVRTVPTDLPPPLSAIPTTLELRRLLDGLRMMVGGRATVPPLPPAPHLRRRGWGTASSQPALVRPYVLAAMAEHHR